MSENINPLDHPICLTHPSRLDEISAWVEHIPFGMFLLDILRPRMLVELGTHTGVSYCSFCQTIQQLDLDTRAYAIDTWAGDEHAGFYGTNLLTELRLYHDPLYGGFSRLVQSTFDEAVNSFSDKSIDLLHIDGLHTYEAVKHDFETWLPKLSDKAVVLFHDTNVRERGFGVWRLWNELKDKHLAFEFAHGHGLGVLCVGNDVHNTLKALCSAPDAQAKSVREFFFTLGSKFSTEIKLSRNIKMLSQEVSEKNDHIQTLLQEKQTLLQEIQTLSQEVNEKLTVIGGLNNQLNDIYRSAGWKLLLRLRRIKEILAPAGSRRARLVQLILISLSVLRHEGLRSFFHKIFNKVIGFIRKPQAVTDTSSVYVPLTNHDVDPRSVKAKAIAFYLPQFHPIPENDEWWGKGFTEWTNVAKAVPNFAGHDQPRLPGELGFYDLRLPEVQERQIELAKKYGIYGFCFYYYWFAGKRLLERPLEQYLANQHLDLPFCLCWANENWTRRWDGAENDILIGQIHTEGEYLHFIRDIAQNFTDPRYIRVDGKPLLLVYRINLLPNPAKAAEIWRTECQRLGIGEIYLAAVQSFGISDPRLFGFDAAIEFPPHHLSQAKVDIRTLKNVRPAFKGEVFDYHTASQLMINKKHGDYAVYKTVMPAWDNTARKQNDAHIFINSSPSAYRAWLEETIHSTQQSFPEDQRFVFINAWNEWAEGTYLEPDRKYGYAYLQATANALTAKNAHPGDIPINQWTVLFVSHDANRAGAQSVLLNILAWFKKHTTIQLKVLCLAGGEWLPQFQALADTLVWSDIQKEHKLDQELLDALELFCAGKPDLIYGNTVVAGTIYDLLSKFDVPILSHFHEMEMSINRYGSQSMASVLKHTSHYIACSGPVRDNLVKNHAVAAEKISVIHETIVPDAVSERPTLSESDRKKARARLGLPTDKFLVIGCGIGMPFRKGADLFIETARILRQRGIDNFHFCWVGDFAGNEINDDQKTWQDHLQRMKRDGTDKYATFLGLKKNVRDYLLLGDVFLLPSREDPFPLVALEAAECRLPIVCFDEAAGGMAEFVETNAGIVVPYLDLDTLASAVITLLENRELRAGLGMQAREKFMKNFTADRIAPRIFSLCRKIAGKKPTVSVIVPNFNHEKYLTDRLQSIFEQSFRDYEVILLDDASTDRSMDLLMAYMNEPDVILMRNEQNTGSPFAQWLKGIDAASADILWIAESDDVSDLDFLKKMLAAFEDSAIKLAYANSSVIDETGKITGDYLGTEYLTSLSTEKWKFEYRVSAEQEINDGLGVKNTILNISSVLFRKFPMDTDIRKKLMDMRIAGDWLFIVHAIKDGYVYYSPAKLNQHRRHSQSVIGKTVSEKKAKDFFREFYTVQKHIFINYKLQPDFQGKWEKYLHQQWRDFFSDEPFEEINHYYSIDVMKTTITNTNILFAQKISPASIKTDPIIVHQMGKVGSKTIELSLLTAYSKLNLQVPIHHIHILNDFDQLHKDALQNRVDPTDFLSAVEQGRNLRQHIDEDNISHWNLVTLVRDPVARNVGTFFHNLPDFIPDWREQYTRGDLNTHKLMDLFLNLKTIHDWPEYWFNTQIKSIPAFDIDVYAEPFPRDIGYKIFPGSMRASLLLIRLENLEHCAERAVHEFLGLENFVLHNENIGEEKDYSGLYREFKKMPLPPKYVESLYNTKMARHFYSDDELKLFTKTWTHTSGKLY